ncbi:uncharacterized protein LOC130740265 [Lotus japonicus]|uniref:uncharacterized protein LOC130740265 n=1 Tax=Lotus japonicus TaxID=34305 RepID=UPI002584AA77|nr:uncharacterized protein LOC130740265 [Lotus japonicus]
MIQIDGTFLYGKYSGTLLIATTQDRNSNVLPLAFAIVEGETLGDWTWFLRLMRVHVTRKQGICLISDRHARILSAVGNPSNGWQPPNAYHVYCIRHVASNFNTRFHNTQQKNELINMGRRYDHKTTNLSEAVNKVFRGARNLPITALVKCTYCRLVEYFVQRGSAAAAQQVVDDIYCNKVMEAMTKNATIAQSHIVRTYSIDRSRFEVEEGFNQQNHRSGYTWRLNLDERTCECGRFQAFKYPCSHVIAPCANQSLDYLQYVDPVYTIQNIVDAYSGQWYPIGNDLNMPPRAGPRITRDPAKIRKKGRPWSTRIRNEMDLRETQSQPSRRSVSLQR